MAICNADYEFTYVDVGAEGKASDGGIWQNCSLCEYMSSIHNLLQIPNLTVIDAIGKPISYFLLADDAFRLGPHILKPYHGTGLTMKQRIFNYRLSRAGCIKENCFGILACRFRIFRKTIEVQPKFATEIVMACCILHNYLCVEARGSYIPPAALDRELGDGTFVPGTWHEEQDLDPLTKDSQQNASLYAKGIRNCMADYFVTKEGEVPWQYKYI